MLHHSLWSGVVAAENLPQHKDFLWLLFLLSVLLLQRLLLLLRYLLHSNMGQQTRVTVLTLGIARQVRALLSC